MAELRQKIYSKRRMMMANVIAGMATGGIYRILLYKCQQSSHDCMPRSCLGAAHTPEHSAEVLEVSIPINKEEYHETRSITHYFDRST